MTLSLQQRLSLGLLLSLVVLFTAQWALVSAGVRLLAEGYIAARLAHDNEALLAALTLTAEGLPSLDPTRLGPVYHQPFSGHYYRVTVGNSTLHSRSLWDQDLSVPDVSPGETRHVRAPGPQGQPLLIVVQRYEKQGKGVTIAAAEDLSSLEEDIGHFQTRYALVSLTILLLLIAIQALIVRSGFRPLENVRKDLQRLERGEIPALDTRVPPEISPLVRELNRMLDVMAQRLQRSRHALSNLAHALKTPLTSLVRMAEKRETLDHTQMLSHTGTINGLIDRELKRARLAGAVTPGRQFDLVQEIAPLIELFNSLYRDKHINIEHVMPSAKVCYADREDMLELLGNLLDNACKWARHRILLTVEGGEGLLVRFEDDGPGCSENDLEKLTQRGLRIDEEESGHGFGLAISKDIVQQYGGEIAFGRSETLGGFLVEVHLPATV